MNKWNIAAAAGGAAIIAGALTIAPHLQDQSPPRNAAETSSLNSTQCNPGYEPRPGLQLDVCLTVQGSTVTPSVTIESIGSTADTCTVAAELWDDAGNRLDDSASAAPATCAVGQVAAASVDLGSLTGITAHTAPDGSLTVHAHARVFVDGQDTYVSGQGDSPAITVPGTTNATTQATTDDSTTTAEQPQPTGQTPPESTQPTGDTTDSCQIDVRANYATGSGSVYHLYVIYTDQTGKPYIFRAGPTSRAPGNFGVIVTYHDEYTEAKGVDWATNAPSTTVLSGTVACGKDACFTSELDRIDAARVPYQALGPNSNSVVYTILTNCDVPARKPVAIAPGWGMLV